MFDALFPPQAAAGALLLLAPCCYALAALLPQRANRAGEAAPWRRARVASGVAFVVAVVASVMLATHGSSVVHLPELLSLGGLGALSLSVRLDALTCVMLVLVSFIGGTIVRYSQSYLDGDVGQPRYVRWLMATLAAVTLLVVTNNLLMLALAWLGTSLSLHHLLTYYADRPQALIAAHKKFIASRVADLCLLGAIAVIGTTLGTLELDAVFAGLDGITTLPGWLHIAAVLLVAGAALKCAQLPFHGWLIQVMEAPTPVSALLHAGVVNLGGFLMIRLAPLMVHAELAQTLLVICGATTAVVAALVMTTRVSIKVALAWSTCAQMGFMLLECGLGAYALALLHLVAHSCYKAHAFLASGSVVEQWRALALGAAKRRTELGVWFGAATISMLTVAAIGWVFGVEPAAEPALWSLATIVALALTPLIVNGVAGGIRRLAVLVAAAAGVTALYFVWHFVFVGLLDLPPSAAETTALELTIALGAFGLLFVLSAVMNAYPHGKLAQALYQTLFAGLYIDELFTRFTFRVWPAKVPRRVPAASFSRTLNQEG